MQFFPRLVFNRSGIILQPVHMPSQPIILRLQHLHLLLQRLCFFPLVLKHCQTIVAEHHAIGHNQRQYPDTYSRCLAPPAINAFFYLAGDNGQACYASIFFLCRHQ